VCVIMTPTMAAWRMLKEEEEQGLGVYNHDPLNGNLENVKRGGKTGPRRV